MRIAERDLTIDEARDELARLSISPIRGGETPEGGTATAEPSPDTGTQGAQPTGEPEAPPVDQRLDALDERMNEVLSAVQSQAPQPQNPLLPSQEDPGQYGDPAQAGYGEDPAIGDLMGQQQGMGPEVPDPTDPGYVQALIAQEARQAAEQMIQPWMEQQEEQRREVETNQLLEDYPELGEQEVATEVMGEAQEWARDLGNPALAGEPAFVELVHLAAKTAARAGEETPAGGGGEHTVQQLESGGAAPGGGPQADAADEKRQRIVNAERSHPIFG
jgi:hypothetical protein